LSDDLGRMQASQIVIEDWGLLNPLVLLHRGKLPMVIVEKTFLSPPLSEAERNYDCDLLENALWVGHTKDYQEIAGINDSIVQAAASAGFSKELTEVVSDKEGRAVFEIFRFRNTKQ